MKRIVEEEPAVVILTGPFVDVRNDIVKSGDITFTFENVDHSFDYEEFFEWLIQRIESSLKSLEKTKVYILPSTHDAHHPYPIPQPPYQYQSKSKIARMLSNPSQLIIRSDVRVSVISGDFLIDMTKSSFSRVPQGGSKLGLPLKETLNQRFIDRNSLINRLMYPVYPSSTMLDTTLYDKMTYDEIPNLVLYNSILGSTIKVTWIHSCNGLGRKRYNLCESWIYFQARFWRNLCKDNN
jgi:DNA polymerase alpha subunit B